MPRNNSLLLKNEQTVKRDATRRILLLLIGFISSVFSITASAQTINQRYHFDQKNLVTCSVLPTDSCIYTSGIYIPQNGNLVGSFLARLGLDGTLEWFKPLSDSTNSIELWYDALISTNDGGFANVGYENDYTNGHMNAYFVKYDQFGDTMFTTKISPWDTAMNGFVKPTQLVQTADSGYALAINIQYNDFNVQIALVKLDKYGNYNWTKEYGNSWFDNPTCLTEAQDGGFLIGAWKTNVMLPGAPQLKWYSHIIKTDSAGNLDWEYLSDETLVEGVHDLIETPDGGYIYGSGWGTENGSSAVFQGYVVKLDDQMQVEWDLVLDGNPRNEGGEVHLSALSDGNYAVADVTHTLDTTLTIPGLGYTDYGRLTKINPQGQIIWQRWYFPDSITGDHFQVMYDMKATNNGFTMVAMSIDYEADSMGQQGWLIQTDTSGCLTPGCGSVGTDETAKVTASQLLIYPNPASNQIAIDLTLPEGTKSSNLQIIDMLGRVMYSEKIPFHNTSYRVNTSNWSSGTYTAIVKGQQTNATQQFIIVKE